MVSSTSTSNVGLKVCTTWALMGQAQIPTISHQNLDHNITPVKRKYDCFERLALQHNHKDQHVAAATSKTSDLRSLSIPLSQFPNIYDTLRGFGIPSRMYYCSIPNELSHNQKRDVVLFHLYDKNNIVCYLTDSS